MSRKTALKVKIVSNELNRKVAEILKEDGEPSSGIQMQILNFIHRKNCRSADVYQKDVEQEFDIRRSTVSGILQRLEKRGMIERQSCKEDNRLKAIFLTAAGEQKVRENIDKLENFDARLINDIPTKELDVFFHVLEKLSENSKNIKIDKGGN